jgi:hypothetical protein
VPQFQSQSVNNLGDLYLINYDLQTRPAAPVLFDNITAVVSIGVTTVNSAVINYTMDAPPILFSQPVFIFNGSLWPEGLYNITNITPTNFTLNWQNPTSLGSVTIVAIFVFAA